MKPHPSLSQSSSPISHIKATEKEMKQMNTTKTSKQGSHKSRRNILREPLKFNIHHYILIFVFNEYSCKLHVRDMTLRSCRAQLKVVSPSLKLQYLCRSNQKHSHPNPEYVGETTVSETSSFVR